MYSTAWLNLFQLAGLKPGEKVLLHAGASGVGSAAIQLCKGVFGGKCWSAWGLQSVWRTADPLGAQGGVLRNDGLGEPSRRWGRSMWYWTRWAPITWSPTSSAGRTRSLGADRSDGRREAGLDLALMLSKRIQLLGSTLRSRDDQFKADLLSDLDWQCGLCSLA